MITTGFGERLKTIRGNLKQDEVARLFGVGTNTYARYEREETYPDSQFIKAFCEHFRVSADWLFFGTGPVNRADRVNVHKAQNINIQILRFAIKEIEDIQARLGWELDPERKANAILAIYMYGVVIPEGEQRDDKMHEFGMVVAKSITGKDSEGSPRDEVI